MPRLLFSVLWIALLSGCSSPIASIPWKVPTEYLVKDSPELAARDLPKLLASYGFEPAEADEPGDEPSTNKVFRFTLRDIATMDDLLQVQRLLRNWSAQNRTPLELNRAVMVFSSLESSTGAQITLYGTATLGAQVLVDIGLPRLYAPLNQQGQWSFLLPPDALPPVQSRGGWVYILVVKDSVRQLFRKNVLSGPQQPIVPAELPAESPLHKQ